MPGRAAAPSRARSANTISPAVGRRQMPGDTRGDRAPPPTIAIGPSRHGVPFGIKLRRRLATSALSGYSGRHGRRHRRGVLPIHVCRPCAASPRAQGRAGLRLIPRLSRARDRRAARRPARRRAPQFSRDALDLGHHAALAAGRGGIGRVLRCGTVADHGPVAADEALLPFANASFDQAIACRPEFVLAHTNLGNLQKLLGRPETPNRPRAFGARSRSSRTWPNCGLTSAPR